MRERKKTTTRDENRSLLAMLPAYRQVRADYSISKDSRHRSRLTGVNPSGSGADYHWRSENDYYKSIEQARAFDRDDGIVGQGIDRLVDQVMQDGFKLRPRTGNEDLDAALSEKWRDWSEDADAVDASGKNTFDAIAALTVRHVMVDGDAFINPLQTGHLETIEGHRVKTPHTTKMDVVLGVRMDSLRKPFQYWIAKDQIRPMDMIKVRDVAKMDARDENGNLNLFHVFNPKRYSQTRGVTVFAPISDFVGIHGDLQFAQLVKAEAAASFALMFKPGANDENYTAPQMGAQTTETQADGSTRIIEDVGPGMMVVGAPGEEITAFSPNIPNPEFFHHAKLVLQIIGINLGIPYNVLMLDASDTNFSGHRGAIDQARFGFRRIQRWSSRQIYTPSYHWKLRQWVTAGGIHEDRALINLAKRVDARALFTHGWICPRWPYLEPHKDVKSDQQQVEGLLNSPRRLLGNRGLDIGELYPEIVNDNARLIVLAIEAAQQIKSDTGVPVTWQQVLQPGIHARAVARQESVNPDDDTEPESGATKDGKAASNK